MLTGAIIRQKVELGKQDKVISYYVVLSVLRNHLQDNCNAT